MFFPFHVRVFLAIGHTDMRKSINGLSVLVAQNLEKDPLSGHLFAFCNKRRNMVKILYWDRNGFCLWHKRLEKQFFRWPKDEKEICEIDHRQLDWLLEGLEIHQQNAHHRLSYATIF
jgi:transposase